MRSKLIAIALLFAASLPAQYVPPGGGGGSLPTGSGNCVVASPANGSSATVACRALVAADINAAGTVNFASPAQITGADVITNGNFAAGLAGWTVSGDGTGWSIVAGQLHHTPGQANKISTAVTLTGGHAIYLLQWTAVSFSAGSSYLDLGADCNSDCSAYTISGANAYLADDCCDTGASVVEIVPSAESDITISLISAQPVKAPVYFSDLTQTSTAFGLMALANHTGTVNSAFGAGALLSNTTGGWNNAFGISALQSNTTGTNNNAMGLGALYSMTTGDSNVAIGSGALSSLIAGSRNFALGGEALLRNIDGHDNVAIGYCSLCFGTLHSNNLIAISTNGQNANLFTGSQTDATNSVLIGPTPATGISSSAGSPLDNVIAINGVATASNSTVIGNSTTTSVRLGGITPATTGARYVCIDTTGKLASQASVCVGT